MTKPIVDVFKLSQMLRSGKTTKQCAKFFGVTPGAISQRKKNLNVAVVKNVALENAHRVVEMNLNTVAQLQKINSDANEFLDVCMAWTRGDNVALQILEGQRRTVRIGQEEIPVEEFKFKDPRELALKAMAEIRNQLRLQLEIFRSLYDMEEVQRFQEFVLSAIGEVSPETRSKIINNLKRRHAIRSGIKVR